MARTALSRPLSKREAAVFRESLAKFQAYFGSRPESARELLAVGESNVDTTLAPDELADWTMVASEFLNLDEFLTK
jgi:hypothetical protein